MFSNKKSKVITNDNGCQSIFQTVLVIFNGFDQLIVRSNQIAIVFDLVSDKELVLGTGEVSALPFSYCLLVLSIIFNHGFFAGTF